MAHRIPVNLSIWGYENKILVKEETFVIKNFKHKSIT